MRPAEILRLRLRCDASAPRLAREAVEQLNGIEPVREDALLVTSELAANAVMHSGSDPSDDIELKAELLPDGVRIAVKDRGHSCTQPILRRQDRHRPGGMGLRVVDAISRRWGSERSHGLSVWAELSM